MLRHRWRSSAGTGERALLALLSLFSRPSCAISVLSINTLHPPRRPSFFDPHHRPDWSVKLNDQDIFNVVFALHPGMLRVLSCDWNVQYHARLNTMMACYGEHADKRAQVTIFICSYLAVTSLHPL
jgi:hypothetical protein